MNKDILKIHLRGILRDKNKIISSLIKKKIDSQTEKLFMYKDILNTLLAEFSKNKNRNFHTKE